MDLFPDTSKPIEMTNDAGEVVGVFIPVINKVLLIGNHVYDYHYDAAMESAKNLGCELPSKDELFILYYFRKEINAIAKSHKKDLPLRSGVWSKDLFGEDRVWVMNYNQGKISLATRLNGFMKTVYFKKLAK